MDALNDRTGRRSCWHNIQMADSRPARPASSASPVFEDADWARDMKRFFVGLRRPVRILHPCAGLNAPERAARELGVGWLTVGDYEKSAKLGTALATISSDSSMLHIGRAGDVLQVRLADLDLSADGIISGPPCPPWSSMGKRLREMDSRSCVFLTVCAWIIHCARHGKLSFCIVENVAGILNKRSRDDGTSFGEWFQHELLAELPTGWTMRAVSANSINAGLPQSRPRVFFVGASPVLTATRRLRRILTHPPLRLPRVPLAQFIDMVAAPEDEQKLSTRHSYCCYV